MQKRSAMLLIVLAIVMGFFLFERPPRFTEIRSLSRSNYISTRVEWVDNRYIVLQKDNNVLVLDTLKERLSHIFKSTISNEYTRTSLITSPQTDKVAIFNTRTLHVWRLFEAESLFVWDVPPDEICDYGHLIPNDFRTTGTEVLIGCWNESKRIIFRVNIETHQANIYRDQTWNAADPYADDIVFGYDDASSSLYAMNLRTQKEIWSTLVDTRKEISVKEITEAIVLACNDWECFLFDRQTGLLQNRLQFYFPIDSIFLLDDQVVVIHKCGLYKIIVKAIHTNGTSLRQVEITLPKSKNGYPRYIIADLSIHGELAISFHQLDEFGPANPEWGPVYIYDIASLDRIATLNAHSKSITMLRFDPTGTYLLTGGLDRTRIWKIQR